MVVVVVVVVYSSSSRSSSNSSSRSSSSSSHSSIKRTHQGRNIWDDPIIEKSQDQDQGQGQGQDHLLPQRAALPPFLVLALTLVLALVRNIIIFSKVGVLVLNQPIHNFLYIFY